MYLGVGNKNFLSSSPIDTYASFDNLIPPYFPLISPRLDKVLSHPIQNEGWLFWTMMFAYPCHYAFEGSKGVGEQILAADRDFIGASRDLRRHLVNL